MARIILEGGLVVEKTIATHTELMEQVELTLKYYHCPLIEIDCKSPDPTKEVDTKVINVKKIIMIMP